MMQHTTSPPPVLGAGARWRHLGLAGCASRPARPSMARVLVVGGGYGGATVAKYTRCCRTTVST